MSVIVIMNVYTLIVCYHKCVKWLTHTPDDNNMFFDENNRKQWRI